MQLPPLSHFVGVFAPQRGAALACDAGDEVVDAKSIEECGFGGFNGPLTVY